MVGLVLVGVTVLGGVLFGLHPAANAIDRWGFSAVGRDADKGALVRIVKLGDPLVLVLGTLLASVLAFGRDRLRALACLVGPPLAAVLVELALKPLVGRHFEGVLSYPSGNVTNVAAVAAALALAATVAMAVAVTGLRWHYPTDALGGAVFGVGVVLLVDGVLHLGEVDRWLPAVLRPPGAEPAAPGGG